MNKRMLFIGGAVVVLVVLAAMLLLKRAKPPAAAEAEHDPNVVEMSQDGQRNIGLLTETVAEELINQKVKVTGVVGPDETKLAHVFPLAQGVVEKVFVRLGDRVQQGQPLLQYDNIELGELVGEHQSKHSDVERELAQSTVATKSLERSKSLIQVEAISPRELEVRAAEKEQADAAVESKRAELAKVEEKLHRFGLSEAEIGRLRSGSGHRTASHSSLRAPLAGVVTKYDVAPGELVTPAKELFTVVDTSNVWVLADIYEKDIASIPTKGPCQVSLSSYPDEVFNGVITYLSDFLDPSTRTAKLRCVVPNKDGRLKLEMFADVIVTTERKVPSIAAPKGAVQEVNGETVVFVQTGPSQFEKRTVKIGQGGTDKLEVLEGLKKGERVVTIGSFQLKTEVLRESIGDEH